jgi:hypothetical protein
MAGRKLGAITLAGILMTAGVAFAESASASSTQLLTGHNEGDKGSVCLQTTTSTSIPTCVKSATCYWHKHHHWYGTRWSCDIPKKP